VAVHVGAAKIYVAAAVEEKNKIEGETQESINFLSFTPRLNVDVLLCGYVYESHPMYDQTQGTGAVFSLLYGY
jgi:hypothetical protein